MCKPRSQTSTYNVTGDCTIFCDVANGSTPYLIFSDSHGREHLYVSSLTSTFLAINPATLISEWPQGQEANNMFERNGLYYACMSNLAGWSYSSAYEVSSPSIQTPSDYSADATFAGTDLNDTYYSQISFVVPSRETRPPATSSWETAGPKTTAVISPPDMDWVSTSCPR
jgi:hypothetical protein